MSSKTHLKSLTILIPLSGDADVVTSEVSVRNALYLIMLVKMLSNNKFPSLQHLQVFYPCMQLS